MYFFFFLIALLSSICGAICGIGGGVIIKPVLDMLGASDISTISFLSSCTVLSMALYNVSRSLVGGDASIDTSSSTPLAIGAAAGGIGGNTLFSMLKTAIGMDAAGIAQSLCLLFLTLGTVIYTINKSKITTKSTKNRVVCVLIGFALGLLSSFLGIGGGPFNLVVLHYFFGMETKRAVQNSLYIILFSQTANLVMNFICHTVPQFDPIDLLAMIFGGVFGGIIGRIISKKMGSKTIDVLFIGLLVVIAIICVYNTLKYIGG